MALKKRKSHCPIHFGLSIFGDAWTLLIIRDLMFKTRSTYGDFLRGEEGIATNVLADRLSCLEREGIIAQKQNTRGYQLTPKGVDLLPLMLEIIEWSARHDPKTAADPDFVNALRDDKPGLTKKLRDALERSPKETS